MGKLEIEAGGVYVKAKDGPFIRVVEEISAEGQVQWRDFQRDDGEPIGRGRCSLYAFRNWAGRPATEEERRRLRWDRARREDRAFVRALIDRIPDDLLHEEMVASEERLRAFLRKVPDTELVLEYKRRRLGRRP